MELNWVFQVDEISQGREDGQQVDVIGRLLAGSVACFADPFRSAFTITWDDAPQRSGWVNNVRPAPGLPPVYQVASVELREDGHLRRGDLLRFQEIWLDWVQCEEMSPYSRPEGDSR
jgi:hypothetical protein